ncbi:uncharacterized protein SRT_17250 [Streptococcus troglodytae]|uniref:Uncharacterized protein n=1 Tax=Streptococcus troglodytae TaxID=1111760 RepID=A0A1L7LLE8_9STRE|nr:hypothetical protein [Streptococcus troglodytae]BAQ24986.1 uncharacterized protein SRT_17250 [Streptococcus troglodytae]
MKILLSRKLFYFEVFITLILVYLGSSFLKNHEVLTNFQILLISMLSILAVFTAGVAVANFKTNQKIKRRRKNDGKRVDV